MAEPKETLNKVRERFLDKIDDDEKLQDKLADYERDIAFKFEDDGNYHMTLSDTELSQVKEGSLEDSDITVTSTSETLEKLLSGDLKPMKAYARKKIKVDASFSDMLKIKDMF